MNRPGDKFLAGSAFTRDKDVGFGGRDLSDRLQHLLHGRRLADDILQPVPLVELLAQRLVFDLERLVPQGAGNPQFQLVDLHPPLGDVVVGPPFHRFDRHFLRTIGGHQDADRRAGKGFGPRDQFHAVFVGQAQVGQQHVQMFFLQQLDRRRRVFGNIDVVAVLQRRAQAVAGRFLVIDDEQRRFNHASAPPTAAVVARAAAARCERWFPARHGSRV